MINDFLSLAIKKPHQISVVAARLIQQGKYLLT
jgi:hypothetical protein